MQTTSDILMIRPVNFTFNAQTAVNNAFQVGADEAAHEAALAEFEGMVQQLREAGVRVLVVNDTPEPPTPDSIFPNNWISFHEDGTLCLYPMFAHNRRAERKDEVMTTIRNRYEVHRTIDFTGYEEQDKFLEGTGSMVLDREQRIAYACLSPRTNASVLANFCAKLNYRPVSFTSVDAGGKPIYHTNVMMCVGDRYVVICLDSIPDGTERTIVIKSVEESQKTLVPITLEQMNQFAGNMLQVRTEAGETILVMSSQAYRSLNREQVRTLESFNPILHAPLDTIERNGGGSARCMMAEIFLERK